MNSKVAQSLSIVLGNACTFKCRHCAIVGTPKPQLSVAEISLLINTINRVRFDNLLLVGGEPTLYIPVINELMSAVEYSPRVIVTTNGGFADTEERAIETLRQIERLNEVQLSYDRFHQEFLAIEKVGNLKKSCDSLGLRFSVILTIKSPVELSMIAQLRKFGDFTIGVQKVVPYGAAKENRISFEYPSFDKEILARSCPNKDNMVYVCGRGFSVCDIPRRGYEGYFFETVEELQASGFYRKITSCNFGDLLREVGVNADTLSADCSCPCVLCEKVFQGV